MKELKLIQLFEQFEDEETHIELKVENFTDNEQIVIGFDEGEYSFIYMEWSDDIISSDVISWDVCTEKIVPREEIYDDITITVGNDIDNSIYDADDYDERVQDFLDDVFNKTKIVAMLGDEEYWTDYSTSDIENLVNFKTDKLKELVYDQCILDMFKNMQSIDIDVMDNIRKLNKKNALAVLKCYNYEAPDMDRLRIENTSQILELFYASKNGKVSINNTSSVVQYCARNGLPYISKDASLIANTALKGNHKLR